MTIPETLAPSHGEATRLIRQRGLVVLIDYHPFMLLKGVPTHFEAPTSEPIAIANTVHLFTDHTGAGRTAGLALLELREQLVNEEWVGTNQRLFGEPRLASHFGPPGQLWDGVGPR